MFVVGIDPGKKGGIAFIDVETHEAEAFEMPELTDLAEILRERSRKIVRVFIEKQHPYPKQGAVSSGNLMFHYGKIIGILTALKIPFEEIPPRRWQVYIHGSKHKKKPRAEKKRRSIEKARQMFPTAKVRKDGPAEALLIAEFGRRQMNLEGE